jgi:hypothetical protein
MRRALIVVQQQPYDWDAARPRIQELAAHFAAYLSEFRSKRESGSKHAVLGPVGKLLNKAASGERNLESLLGYTVRIHEMSNRSSYLSPQALGHLREGAAQLIGLLEEAPLTARERIVAQVDDAVYYLRRKQRADFLEGRRQSFASFLRDKYDGDEARLRTAWGAADLAFDEVPYPSEYRVQKAKSETMAQDIRAFRASLKDDSTTDEEEEETA